MRIILIGIMGCGKSSVGKELSTLLSYSYIDLDTYIEEKEGQSINTIFFTKEESGFRELEQKALTEVFQFDNVVLSLGGGSIQSEKIAEFIKTMGLCFYLKASQETLAQRLIADSDSRPLLHNYASSIDRLSLRLGELLKAREDLYQKTAHYIIEVDGKSIYQICKEIVLLLDM